MLVAVVAVVALVVAVVLVVVAIVVVKSVVPNAFGMKKLWLSLVETVIIMAADVMSMASLT